MPYFAPPETGLIACGAPRIRLECETAKWYNLAHCIRGPPNGLRRDGGDRRESMRFIRAIQPCNLGLMCIHIWIYCSTHRAVPSDGMPLMTIMYLVLSVSLVAMMLLERTRPLPERAKRRIDIASAACMAASAVLLALHLPVSGAATTFAGAVLGGASVGWTYARWAEFYAELEIHYAAPLVLLTMALGSLAKTVVDLLPSVPAAVVLACMPVVAYMTLYRSFATVRPAPEPYRYYNSRTVRSLWRVGFGIAVYSFTVGVIQSTPLAQMASTGFVAIVAKHAGEIVVALALLAWVVAFKRGLSFGRIWNLVLVLMATALIFAPYLDEALGGYLFTFVGVAQTFVIIILFLALADVARHSSYSAIAVFAAGWLAYTFPFALGDIFGESMQAFAPDATLAMAAIVWVLVIVTLLFFDESSAGKRLIFTELNDGGDEDTPAKRFGAQQQALNEEKAADMLSLRCAVLAEELKLTPREHEILELMARGRSKTYIAEAFFISENTVRGHVKHLYAKLDVHSKQELVDRVEQTEARS